MSKFYWIFFLSLGWIFIVGCDDKSTPPKPQPTLAYCEIAVKDYKEDPATGEISFLVETLIVGKDYEHESGHRVRCINDEESIIGSCGASPDGKTLLVSSLTMVYKKQGEFYVKVLRYNSDEDFIFYDGPLDFENPMQIESGKDQDRALIFIDELLLDIAEGK